MQQLFQFQNLHLLVSYTKLPHMLKAIAIDDEPLALEVIKSLSDKVPFLQMEAYFTDAFKALDFLNKNKVDLFFLDIKMPDITGIEWVKTLTDPPMVIFTTAYSEHAIDGFELNALDYLLKPFSLARFLKAANKAQEMHQLKSNQSNTSSSQPTTSHIFIKSGLEQIKVQLEDIAYVQSAGNYVQFMVNGKKITSRLTMAEVEEILPTAAFTRVHRSFIVRDASVTKMDKYSVYIQNETIPIGTAFIPNLEKKFLS